MSQQKWFFTWFFVWILLGTFVSSSFLPVLTYLRLVMQLQFRQTFLLYLLFSSLYLLRNIPYSFCLVLLSLSRTVCIYYHTRPHVFIPRTYMVSSPQLNNSAIKLLSTTFSSGIPVIFTSPWWYTRLLSDLTRTYINKFNIICDKGIYIAVIFQILTVVAVNVKIF